MISENANGPGERTDIVVFFGVGDGTMSRIGHWTAGGVHSGLAAGDFNGDGFPDIAVSNWTPYGATDANLFILFGDGNGNFTVSQSPFHVQETLIAADFDQDGRSDLATVDVGDDGVDVLYAVDNGDFERRQPAWLSVSCGAGGALSAIDLDGDGFPDLAATDFLRTHNGVGVHFFRNSGSRNFEAPKRYTIGVNGAILDIDGDAGLDFISADGGRTPIIFRDFAPAQIPRQEGTMLTVPPYSGVIADFDKDGYADVIDVNGYPFLLRLTKGGRSGTIARPGLFEGPFHASGIVQGDFNEDGYPDIAALGEGIGSSVTIFANELGR